MRRRGLRVAREMAIVATAVSMMERKRMAGVDSMAPGPKVEPTK